MRTRKWHMLENKDCGVTAFHMSAIASFSMCMLVGASYSQRVVKSERRTLICSRCTEYWMIMGTWIEWWSCFFFSPAKLHSVNPQARVAGRHTGPNMETK
jgi:hypothetical protein